MKRERLKKLSTDVRRQFPPPRPPGKMVIVKIFSDRALTDEEIDARAAKIPRKPGEHRILINVIKVTSRPREISAEVTIDAGEISKAPELTDAELELEVARLEAKKARLIAARKAEGKTAEVERRSRRVDEVKRARRREEDRRRRKI